jgi:hypothetical protein
MEAFEVQTPVGTFSVGIVTLLLLLLFHGHRISQAVGDTPALRSCELFVSR